MKPWQLRMAAIAMVLLAGQSIVLAGTLPQATMTMGIDGAMSTWNLNYDPDALGVGKGAYTIDGINLQNANGRIDLSGYLDPDPTILFAGAVVDFGAPSTFSFSWVLPLAPLVTNPSVVSDSLSGSATDSGTNGVTLTPVAPPAGIPTDGDGIPEIQVFTVSSDGGLTWQNVGLDQGPGQIFPNGALSAVYGPFSEGPTATIAGGPWTHMRADLNFQLSGQGDAFSFTGRKDLVQVPEPGAVILSAFALAALFASRRRARS